jgi:hypothetical protein
MDIDIKLLARLILLTIEVKDQSFEQRPNVHVQLNVEPKLRIQGASSNPTR